MADESFEYWHPEVERRIKDLEEAVVYLAGPQPLEKPQALIDIYGRVINKELDPV